MDLIRPTPRDPNFTTPADVMRILRPELIAGYAEYLRLKTLTSNESKRKEENATEEEKAAENEKIGKWKEMKSISELITICRSELEVEPQCFRQC